MFELSRREVLKGAAALPLVYATPLRAAPPPAEAITPALIAAATKEGQVAWYTSADLQLAEKVGKAFERKFPGIRARVERAGGERIFARVAQETCLRFAHRGRSEYGRCRAVPGLETSKLACGLCAGGCCKTYPAGPSRRGRHLRDGALIALCDGLQYRAGEARRGADRFCRPA